jgi:hypothetical protein
MIEIKIYRDIILFVFVYGCGNLFLTLKEECGLTVFKDEVARKIF